MAVLHSNIAACHIKLTDWKKANDSAIAALAELEKLERIVNDDEANASIGQEDADEEIISAGAAVAEDTSVKGKLKNDIEKLKVKILLRRARARAELGGWSYLQGAEEGRSNSTGVLPCSHSSQITRLWRSLSSCQRLIEGLCNDN